MLSTPIGKIFLMIPKKSSERLSSELKILMPLAGLEPARGEPLDFESSASANSATAAEKY